MREPVPYTPEVKVKLINGAYASDLGWSQSFYERICRQYGIHPRQPKESVASLMTKAVTEAPLSTEKLCQVFSEIPVPRMTGDPFRDAVSERWGRWERRVLGFEFIAGKHGAVKKTILVDRHEAAAMLTISRSQRDGGWVIGMEICEFEQRKRNQSMKVQISGALRNLRNALVGTPLDIESRPGTGCRVVYAKSKEPAKIKIFRLGEIEIE